MSHLLIQADARRIPLADRSIHAVITSPPYWGLRDYQTGSWVGGNADCNHKVICGPVTEKYKVCKCGARRIDAQLGLEPTPEAFVAKLVAVFAEVRRVLRPDGTCWVNLGDSYASSGAVDNRPDNTTGMGGMIPRSEKRTAPTVGRSNRYRLRSDLTPEQRAYVLTELAKAELI